MNDNLNNGSGGADGLDIKLDGSSGVSADDRREKAREMAQRIAANISGDDADAYDTYERTAPPRQSGEEATREREMPARNTTGTARRSQSQGSSRNSQTRRSGASSASGNAQRKTAPRSSQPQRRSNGGSAGYPSRKAQSSRGRRRKKSSGGGAVVGFLLGFIVVLVGVGYFVGLILTNGAFLPNTSINGVDVSKMTLAEATQALMTSYENDNIEITKIDGSIILVPYSSIDYHDDAEQQVAKLYGDINRKTWFKSLFSAQQYSFTPTVEYDEEKLSQELDSIVWGTTEPQNAYITRSDSGFVIVDEKPGDKVNYDVLKPYLLEQISSGNMKINISGVDCYYSPEIKREDLLDKLEYYEKVGGIDIKIDFDYNQEELTIEDFSSWITFNADGTYSVDRSQVAQYVGYLADTYDTYGSARAFHATLQGDIYVEQGPQGTYGWLIDQEKTTDKIVSLMENGESATIDPVYATRLDNDGYAFFTYKALEGARSAESDIGDTYIEVDLTAQHIWYYEKNELKFETDQVVSGLASNPKRKTPEGVYEILDMRSPYYMSGDGYSNVYCKYFIRVSYEGIGFHDLSRGSYGGDIYLTNGSHGCLNMKKAEVEKLYNLVSGGTPVIMYY